MKKYQITEIISKGNTKETSGNESTGYFSLRCTPKMDNPFEFGDGKPVVLNVFENQQPALFKALTENEDDAEKFKLHLVVRDYKSPTPFYVLDAEGNRRTYKNPQHKDYQKDVVANNITVVALDKFDDESNDNTCMDMFERQLSQLDRNGLMVDLKDPEVMKYEDYRARRILGISNTETIEEETTE